VDFGADPQVSGSEEHCGTVASFSLSLILCNGWSLLANYILLLFVFWQPYQKLKRNGPTLSWTGTSKTMSQNKPFLR
jgi:hypothetical protein